MISGGRLLQGQESRPLNPLGLLYRHLGSATIIGVSSSLIMASLLLFLMFKPFYKAQGHILIAPTTQVIIEKSENRSIVPYFHDYARTQVQRIGGHEVIGNALLKLPKEIAQDLIPPHLDGPEAVTFLTKKMLEVEQIPLTHMISVKVQGPTSRGLDMVVNAIMESYLEKVSKQVEKKNRTRLRFLQNERYTVKEKISKDLKVIDKAAEQAHNSSFEELYNSDRNHLHRLQIAHTSA